MFMICGSGLSGYIYDMWQWSVWICLLVVCLDMFISGIGLPGCLICGSGLDMLISGLFGYVN